MNILIQCVINGVAQGAVYTIMALSYTILFGTLKIANFAQGDISVKVGPGHGHLKRAQKTSPANQEVFRARVSKWEEVRQNQRRSCLGIQGT